MNPATNNYFDQYTQPVPRYSCYPIPSCWQRTPTHSEWFDAINLSLNEDHHSWSLYLHLPFCESLCTYCACNISITRDHERELPYRNLLLKEWDIYKKRAPLLLKRPLKNIHLGGGSPTFFSAENLKILISTVLEDVQCSDHFFGSIEVDPRRVTPMHLLELSRLGFSRLSVGVQDFDPEVQRVVNRIQSPAMVRNLVTQARELGFQSIHFDLIYGLPKQNIERIVSTIESTLELQPHCVALYGLAKMPWIKPSQRLFRDEDLPNSQDKIKLQDSARHLLLSVGNYFELGMDHFVLDDDSLFKAYRSGTLHHNFTGYTETKSDLLLGLGVSAISETPTCFHQNEKVLPIYEKKVIKGEVPTLRGHILTCDDQIKRKKMVQILTQKELILTCSEKQNAEFFLRPMIEDHLIEIKDDHFSITKRGRAFLPHICSAWDHLILGSSKQEVQKHPMLRRQTF